MSDFHIETRRRSRSKTPFLRSSCDHEACEHAGEEGHVHHHKKKATSPNVHTIIEETVEVTSSSSAPSINKAVQSKSQQKTKTSDYSSEDASPETKTKKSYAESQHKQFTTTSSTTSSTVITKTRKAGGSTAATSTPKSNSILESFAAQFSSAGGGGITESQRRRKEIAQNEINSEFERSQKAAAAAAAISSSKNRSFSYLLGNTFSSSRAAEQHNITNDGDMSDHIAYLEYKRAGEYWKKTPKTDYTYSELSPHRRVLAPGIVAMPNMSRKSLENHHERIHYMIERDPAQEEYIRRRYETSKYTQNRRAAEKLTYDSGDEVDYTKYENYQNKQRYFNGSYAQHSLEESSWFVRFITTIVTTVTSAWSTLTGAGGTDESALYRTKYANEERGFFGSIGHGISSAFLALFRYVYIFISSVLCLDTWLLKSSNAENKTKKRFLLFLLLLLPLLLLAGLYYFLHPNEPFPPKRFSEFTLTLPSSLPALPKIDMSEFLNEEKYQALKTQTLSRLSDFQDWSSDYLLYLKTISQNIADEGRKLFQREEHFERV